MVIVSGPVTLEAFLIATRVRLPFFFVEMPMKYDGKWYIFIGRKFWRRNDRKFCRRVTCARICDFDPNVPYSSWV